MEEKILSVTITEETGYDEGHFVYQELQGVSDHGTKLEYSVGELSESPVTISDLFSAEEFVQAVELGMALAEEGYTGISINYKDEYGNTKTKGK